MTAPGFRMDSYKLSLKWRYKSVGDHSVTVKITTEHLEKISEH